MPYGYGGQMPSGYDQGWQEQMHQYPQQPGAYHHLQQQQQNPNHQPSYRHPAPQQHHQFSAPNLYDQGQLQQVYYQTPSSQQPQYPSPITPHSQFPHDDRYSPDPLQYYQPPPQGYQHQQQPPPRPSASQPQLLRPEVPRQPTHRSSSPSQWQQSSQPPRQPSLASPVNTPSQVPQQRQQQQHRPPSQSHPPSVHSQTPVPLPQSQQIRQDSQPGSAQTQHQTPTVVNPQDLQRKVAHVQVPVVRMLQRTEDSMERGPKRRRSNDGRPLPACDDPPRRVSTQHLKQSQGASSPLTELASSQIQAIPANTPSVDYQAALLTLSDEYITAAYSMSGSLNTAEVDEDILDHYHALLATGMGCLESVLNNYRIPDARKEARIRLRLASLLFEETDNDTEAEEVLSKGISTCDRFRLTDAKYAMHHLLARIWHSGGKTKAAMKAVDKLIVEAEKLGLTHWIYAFRFLRLSFGLQAEHPQTETATLVKNLSAISDIASQEYNISVQIVASAFTALVHLRSTSPDSLDMAQRALATARAHQLGPEMASMPQVKAMLDFLDLACSLVNLQADQAITKMRSMQSDLDAAARNPLWPQIGNEWFLPLAQLKGTSADLELDTQGIFKTTPSGDPGLSFKWLTKTQVYTLGFLLSGLSNMHKNAGTEHHAESFLSEGVKLSNATSKAALQSLTVASTQYNHQRRMRLVLLLYVVFAMCGRSEWETATKGVANIRRDLQHLERQPDGNVLALVTYLEALCKHGLGDLAGALHLYRSPELVLTPEEQGKAGQGTVSSVKVIATLNAILIMRMSMANDAKVDQLLAQIEPFCTTHTNSNGNEYGNKALKAAYNLLGCTSSSPRDGDGTILKTKQYMQNAMQAARSSADDHLLCMLVNIMTDLFFTNVVGEQSEKSAKAGRNLAKKTQNKLWTAVSDRMYADTLDRSGKTGDAGLIRNEAWETMHTLPPLLQEAFVDVKRESVM
ncbi:unnamed protein product [Zymoseptoria tritici ST99CH_1A5]|uniref:Cohesin loading factor n=1 Tax=Zymoseptoria tritici ST99CH_1A5 TaxID=1276529 RepID=A0A1Y6LDQ7_ZYMTR|nr:unnamed protein product [Zymoseptoria tritici ST99CH_1A5]